MTHIIALTVVTGASVVVASEVGGIVVASEVGGVSVGVISLRVGVIVVAAQIIVFIDGKIVFGRTILPRLVELLS